MKTACLAILLASAMPVFAAESDWNPGPPVKNPSFNGKPIEDLTINGRPI